MSKEPSSFSRSAQFFVVALILTSGFFLIFLRLLVIQGFQYEKWHRLATRQHEQSIAIHAERGTLYDRHGRILAINGDVPSLYAVPEKIAKQRETARRLAPHLKVDANTLTRRFERKGFIWLARKIDSGRWEAIRALKLSGVDALMESKRFYPKQALFGHIVGFTGIDNQGIEGIEYQYEEWLKGETGAVRVVRDAYGRSIYPKGFNYIPPARGRDLVLTLDETIQHIAARELRQAVSRTGAQGGVVLVMNPEDGAILAMVVDPPFDPNTFVRSRPSDWRNRAITDMYEPGSTFKIVAASGALEEKKVRPEEIIDCEGGTLPISGAIIHDHHPMGKVSFADVIAKSSNIGIAKVADRLGPEKMVHYTRLFGFGAVRGIDLPGESAGLLRDLHQWSARSLPSIAIGQEVGVTPLQMTVALSVIANGGWRVTPYVVQAHGEGVEGVPTMLKTDYTAHALEQAAVLPARRKRIRVLSPETAETMVTLLKRVVTPGGTGQRAAVPGFEVAGKTGTAQKVDPVTGQYAENRYMSSFVGFVPADKPVVTIFVMLDEPGNGAFGGEVAAPVFSVIGREILHYLRIPPASLKQMERI